MKAMVICRKCLSLRQSPIGQRQGTLTRPCRQGTLARPSRQGTLARPSRQGTLARPSRRGTLARPSRRGTLTRPCRRGTYARRCRRGPLARRACPKVAPGESLGLGDARDFALKGRQNPSGGMFCRAKSLPPLRGASMGWLSGGFRPRLLSGKPSGLRHAGACNPFTTHYTKASYYSFEAGSSSRLPL